MNSIIDFLDLDHEDRARAACKYGKYIAERCAPRRTIKLYLVFNSLIEFFYDTSDVIIKDSKLLYSYETLDLYIDSMLKKKKQEENTRTGSDFLRCSLEFLMKLELQKYEHIYLPDDSQETLLLGDIPFNHLKEEDFTERTGSEPQDSIYCYVEIIKLGDDKKITREFLPGPPVDYERPGDRYLVIRFCPGEGMYLGSFLNEWTYIKNSLGPKVIWSNRTANY